ncbi:MAG: hypothetical protein ACYDB7_11215, partial [Mycobacteriales bacterium]
MIVVHGFWSVESDPRGELVVWAEDSEAPAHPPPRRGRRPARQPHPFAVPAAALAAIVANDGKTGTAALVLPNEGRGPGASAEVQRTRAAPATSTARVDGLWEVPVVALEPSAALGYLLAGHLPAASEYLEGDVERPIAGADLRVLQALAEFAVDLVGRGRVLPGVREAGDGRAMAMWSALVSGADAVWLRTVAAGLPGSFTATCPADADRGAAALRSIAAATDAMVDAAVRFRLGPAPRQRAAASFRSALVGTDPYFTSTAVALGVLDQALADWQREVTQGGA